MSPFNTMLYTNTLNWDGSDASYPVGEAPVIGLYNPEVAAGALERHYTGEVTMPADQLMTSEAKGGWMGVPGALCHISGFC